MTDAGSTFQEAFGPLRTAARLWRWPEAFALARSLRRAHADRDSRLLIAETLQDWTGVLDAAAAAPAADADPRRSRGPLLDTLAQDQRAMMELWWNRDWPDAATRRRILTQFRRAVRRADMLGIVPEARVLRIYQTQSKLVTSHRGVARVRAYIATHRGPDQAVTSTQIQRDFAEWGLWEDVLRAIPGGRVRWIGPHEMAGVLRDGFGLTTDTRILIPGEAKYTGIFDPETRVPGALIDSHDAILHAVTQAARSAGGLLAGPGRSGLWRRGSWARSIATGSACRAGSRWISAAWRMTGWAIPPAWCARTSRRSPRSAGATSPDCRRGFQGAFSPPAP